MKKITKALLGEREAYISLRKAKCDLRDKGYCHQCCESECRGRCKCNKHKDLERLEVATENRRLSVLLRDFKAKEIDTLEGLCVQCKNPWYDGICDCWGRDNDEVNAYCEIAEGHRTPIYFPKDEVVIKRDPPPTAKPPPTAEQLSGVFSEIHTEANHNAFTNGVNNAFTNGVSDE